ncbi:NADH dehydrogenase 1 beta subcomplex subunit 7 ndufb7 [Cichlidogyrus casuarinus]|uniref:NADH dehydrogenase [ubiquinone] 1 beta subcomplex subunit 7 n=1 Tax=Cichlidogyrus casuarinus TaxID=1844966 RepID=A0ABD2Q2D0_9PLAT
MSTEQSSWDKFIPQIEHVFATYKNPETMPDTCKRPSFDPMQGFPNGRKKIEAVLTDEEMFHAGLPSVRRDYCGHFTLAFQKCKNQYPILVPIACADLRHGLLHCLKNERMLRSKEYERERRLMAKSSN